MYRFYSSLVLISLMTLSSGCASREAVAPSQNASLNTVSPSDTTVSEGGAMQRALDSWLKEEWAPLTATTPDGKIIQNKTQPSQAVTTATAPAAVVSEPADETPFTLQKYADKWKVYQENKAKMNAEKPKEDSNIEKILSMPVIGQ